MTGRATATTAALVAATLALTACGATTFDESRVSTTIGATTTTRPVGDASELLPRLADALAELSLLIGPRPDNSPRPDSNKRDQVGLVSALWDAVRDQVIAVDPAAAESLQRMVDLAAQAVERNRPADADKAAKFAASVIEQLTDEL